MKSKTDLQRLLALALDGDDKAQSKLTALIVRSDNCIWKSIIEGAAVSTLEAAELAKLPPSVSECDTVGLAPFVRLVRSSSVINLVAKRFKYFIQTWC